MYMPYFVQPDNILLYMILVDDSSVWHWSSFLFAGHKESYKFTVNSVQLHHYYEWESLA